MKFANVRIKNKKKEWKKLRKKLENKLKKFRFC